MPYLISNLLEGQGKPLTVHLDTPISQALTLMVENDFSQLPVVDRDNRPLGLITNQSILRALNNFGVRLEELCATDAMTRVDTFSADDDLFDVLNRLQDNNAVLVVDNRGVLSGIVSDYDATAYFQRRAEDMMLIEDIEVMIRNIVLSVYTDKSGQIDEPRLREATRAAKTRNKNFERLSMSDYVTLFLHEQQWDVYGSLFSLTQEAILRLFDNVRYTRNQLAHFRGETTARQRQQLRFCADWLARYHDQIVDTAQESQKTESVDILPETHVGVQHEEEPAPGESRYAPLAIWLLNLPAEKDVVELTFDQIEEIIGGDLPASAYKHRAWWANDSVSHPQSQQWLDVGWRAAAASTSQQQVRFARIGGRQRAYIDFYSKIIDRLNKQHGFEDRRPSPDGASWCWIRGVTARDRSLGYFNYSFGRGGIFRVELYIDTGEQQENKEIFDGLYSQREIIEANLGQALSWQRLDERRACRIAWIMDGSITDSEAELAALRQTAVPAMVSFIAEMEPRIQEVVKEVV